MADEPDNMTLRLLREIREKQDEHDKRFDKLETDVEELRSWVVHALGVTTTQFLKNREQDETLSEHDKRLRTLEDMMEAD